MITESCNICDYELFLFIIIEASIRSVSSTLTEQIKAELKNSQFQQIKSAKQNKQLLLKFNLERTKYYE